MQSHQIASPSRITALAVCVVALALALAGPAPAKTDNLSERAGDTPTAALPQVGDRPSERVAASTTSSPQSSSGSSSSDDGGNAPLIVGLSLVTVALLGSGTYVTRRRRHVAPGH